MMVALNFLLIILTSLSSQCRHLFNVFSFIQFGIFLVCGIMSDLFLSKREHFGYYKTLAFI